MQEELENSKKSYVENNKLDNDLRDENNYKEIVEKLNEEIKELKNKLNEEIKYKEEIESDYNSVKIQWNEALDVKGK